MNKIKGIATAIKYVAIVAKYVGFVVIIAETLDFFVQKIKEKYPETVNDAE